MATKLAYCILPLTLWACTHNIIMQETAPPAEDGTVPTDEESDPSVQQGVCAKDKSTMAVATRVLNTDASTGEVCNPDALLAQDDSYAALDWQGGATSEIDGRNVSGCVAFRFGRGVTISSLKMSMRPMSAGCGHACTGDKCGARTRVLLYAGSSMSKLRFLQVLPITSRDFSDYQVTVYESFSANAFAICRDVVAEADDVAIEHVVGYCR